MTCNNKKINDLRKLEVTKVKVKNVLLSIKVDTSQLKLQKLKQKEKISKEKPYFGKNMTVHILLYQEKSFGSFGCLSFVWTKY